MTIDTILSPALAPHVLAPHALAIGMPGPFEWVIIGIIGLLLFGKRLPEVGRSVAKGIVEFKQGLKEVQDDFEETGRTVSRLDDRPAKRPLPAGTERANGAIDAGSTADARPVDARTVDARTAETVTVEPTHTA